MCILVQLPAASCRHVPIATCVTEIGVVFPFIPEKTDHHQSNLRSALCSRLCNVALYLTCTENLTLQVVSYFIYPD